MNLAEQYLKANFGTRSAMRIAQDMQTAGFRTVKGRSITPMWVSTQAAKLGLKTNPKLGRKRRQVSTTAQTGVGQQTESTAVVETLAFIAKSSLAKNVKLRMFEALI